MTPQDIIEAFINSPNAIRQILDALEGENKHLEHYWALTIEDNHIKINYEYYGKETEVPVKFIDRKMIPLHSHVGIHLPEELIPVLKFELSKKKMHELDTKEKRIHGTSNPSKEDIFAFILNGNEVFGITSLYTGYVKISFYDPSSLDENDLVDIINDLTERDKYLEEKTAEGANVREALDIVRDQLNMWDEDKKLSILAHPPHSAHLIIPL